MMVDVTYQMVLSTLQTLGILVGIFYYVMTLRNQNNSRKAQLLLSLQKDIADFDSWKRHRETNYWEWADYDDFEKKYGSDNNPEAYASRLTDWYWMNTVGLMIKNNLIDAEMTYDTFGSSIIWSWQMWEPIILEQRSRYMGDNWMEYFEFLGKCMIRIQKTRNITWKAPETGAKYSPDT